MRVFKQCLMLLIYFGSYVLFMIKQISVLNSGTALLSVNTGDGELSKDVSKFKAAVLLKTNIPL